MMSLRFNIEEIKPQIIMIQETKIKRKSQINIEGYTTFPTVRGDSGGGVLISCLTSLNPVLIFEGDCECEILVIQISLNDHKSIRVITGYGPQECAPLLVREKYRSTMEEQIERAHLSGCSIIITEDANAKLGSEIIEGAPNPISENGKLLNGMIQRQNLSIINNSKKCCGGPITRSRTKKNSRIKESSCIDYIFVSEDMEKCLESAFIDSKQLYSLTKYTNSKGKPCIKKSDHYTLIATFKVEVKENKPARREIFKLRDAEGLMKFSELTENCDRLRKCIRETDGVEENCNRWYKEIEKILHQSFRKIRISSNPPKKTIDHKIKELMSFIKHLKEEVHIAAEMLKPVLKLEIGKYEKQVAVLQGNKCKKIIQEQVEQLTHEGCFSFHDAWKIKKKIFPKCNDPPFAVQDKNGNNVTDYDGILEVMKSEFKFRLRNRTINPEYEELKELKEYLCHLRLKITETKQYSKWELKDLHNAINKLKNNKCRDPHGHINELYKHMGSDGLSSLLTLLNQIKDVIMMPSKLCVSNISTIYKGKGSRQDVINLRGIFKLPIIRNILDRMVCFEEECQIGPQMGPFQVGNQKKRNIRDHTLIVHAVINEAHRKKQSVDVLFTDIKQCFDSIWLDEATNDLYNSGVTSRSLNLLYEGNRKTQMCVETNFGQSERAELNKVVMQGSVPGGLICSNQLSKLCNRLFKEGNVFMYDGKIPIPPLAMVDDIAAIAICNSVEGLDVSVKTDTFIQRKKLEGQTGEGKCQWVHIGKDKCRSTYHMHGNELSEAEIYKYLGDKVADSWEILYTKRWEKAQGYSATCRAMSTEISLGYQIYSTAKLLHQSIFINGTLTNMETWPNFTSSRIEMFERVEQAFLRKILQAHSKTPIECLYLELGLIPLRFHLMKRRIMHLSTIIQRPYNEITKQVILCQKEYMYEGEVYTQTKKDMNYLSITDGMLEENTDKLQTILTNNSKAKAFEFLIEKAKTHSKVNHNIYKDIEGCKHYNDPRFTPDLANNLFKFRTRTYLVKNNFRNNYRNTNILCPLCEKSDDTQEHLFSCKSINQQCKHQYNDIFSEDIDTLLGVARELKELVEARDLLLTPENNEEESNSQS